MQSSSSTRNINQYRKHSSPKSSDSSFEQSFDAKIEKSALLAKLDEMTKAIDIYKEIKTKGSYCSSANLSNNPIGVSVSSRNVSSQLLKMNSRTTTSNNTSTQAITKKITNNASMSCLSPKIQQKSDSILEANITPSRKQQQVDVEMRKISHLISVSSDEDLYKKQTQTTQQLKNQDIPNSPSCGQTQDNNENLFTVTTINNSGYENYNTLGNDNYNNNGTGNSTLNLYLDVNTSPNFNNMQNIIDTQNSQRSIDNSSHGKQIQMYDQDTQTKNPELRHQGLQCDLEFHQQSEFIDKHKQQLQTFEEMLSLLKQQLALQQESENELRNQINKMVEEIQVLSQEKYQAISREQQLLQQTEQLVKIVDDQTEELKCKDIQMNQLQDYELKYFDLQRVQSQLTPQIEVERLHDQFENEKKELRKQIEDFQGKLALEFSKKRKAKQEYEEQVASIEQENTYYKEKYLDMKDLLAKCTEQLREFEELNQMRNDVIEKLERENTNLKQILRGGNQSSNHSLPTINQNSIMQTPSVSSLQPSQSSELPAPQLLLSSNQYKNNQLIQSFAAGSQMTPGKEDKSFSLNLQQVNCERSRQMSRDVSRISEKNDISRVTEIEQICQDNDLMEVRKSLGGTLYMSERKASYYNRRNGGDRGGGLTQQLTELQSQMRAGPASQKLTPKGQRNLPKQSTFSNDQHQRMEFQGQEYMTLDAQDNNPQYHTDLELEQARQQDYQQKSQLLSPVQSISQYEQEYKRKRFEQNYLSPNGRDTANIQDSHKLSFGNMKSPIQLSQDPYSQSEAKYTNQKYQKLKHDKENDGCSSALLDQRALQDMSPLLSSRSNYRVQHQQQFENQNKSKQIVTYHNNQFINGNFEPHRQLLNYRDSAPKQQHLIQYSQAQNSLSYRNNQTIQLHAYPQDNRIFRVLASDDELQNRDCQSGLLQGYSNGNNSHLTYSENDTQSSKSRKKPFEYQTNSMLQQNDNSVANTAITHNNYQSSCTFAQIQNESLVYQNNNETQIYGNNDTFVTHISANSKQKSQQSKSSIRDEIKKLHNNINTLRQKMNIPSRTQINNYNHQSEKQPQRSNSGSSSKSTLKGSDESPTHSTRSFPQRNQQQNLIILDE
ncbi:UNKNOWN [Stylonychia lemnae]|uniref:Uncharacterized protein n=1 Tax=Stylonychia lemnae TaxID=5949 RepID=A0A078ALY9_STYLE|nr:UNKNOWN [Stylonychia lemnae]|eukprot:CDW83375.1 UNKNOWN [Stylonychia lemnae]